MSEPITLNTNKMLFAPLELALTSVADSTAGIDRKDLSHFTAGLDVVSVAALFIAEMERFKNVNGYGIEKYMEARPDWHPANIGQPWFGLLQNCGDILPGFVISTVSYWALEGVNSLVKRKIPENVLIFLSVTAGISAIVAHETGNFALESYSRGSIPDIVFGSLGPIALGGLHFLLGSLAKDTGSQIEDLELEVLAKEGRINSESDS